MIKNVTKLLLIFSIFFGSVTYHTQTNACIFKFLKGMVFTTGLATISYWTLKAAAQSEKNNSNKNGPANQLLRKVDNGAEKIVRVIKETATNCKESINNNFNTDVDSKISEIKKDTKSFLQKSYDWIGYKLGFKDKA